MPDELKLFFELPLPNVEKGFYELQQPHLKISFVRSGIPQGIPVVFIHGTPGSWEDWKLVLDRERLKSKFHMIAVDRPGWGPTSKAGQVYGDIADQSRYLGSILELAAAPGEYTKTIVVGHSLGGPIALRMALDYQHQIGAVVLLAPSLDPDLDAVLWYNRLVDNKLAKFFLPDILAKANDEVVALPAALRTLGKDLATLDIPIIMVQGLKDKLVDPGNARYARKLLSPTIYHEVMLPNFGHLIPHLRPAEVIVAVEEAARLAFGSPHQPIQGSSALKK